jgi:porin
MTRSQRNKFPKPDQCASVFYRPVRSSIVCGVASSLCLGATLLLPGVSASEIPLETIPSDSSTDLAEPTLIPQPVSTASHFKGGYQASQLIQDSASLIKTNIQSAVEPIQTDVESRNPEIGNDIDNSDSLDLAFSIDSRIQLAANVDWTIADTILGDFHATPDPLPLLAQQPSSSPSTSPAPSAAPAPTPSPAPPAAAPPPLSTALNIIALRSLRKPVGNKVLDTGVSVAGIRAKDTSEKFFTRDFLTGNWGGFRDYLYKKGIDLYLVHFIDAYGSLAGGIQQKPINYSGITLVGLDFYTSRFNWWKNGQFHLTATHVEGVSVGRDQSGALNSLYFVDPTEYGPRLFELWYGHQLGKRKQYEFRIGTIFPFVRIAAAQTSSLFTNTSFQYPNFLGVTDTAGNRIGQSVAFAAAPLGIQFSYIHSPEWLFIGQIQDGFGDLKGGTQNRTNFHPSLSADEGVEGIFEAVYRLNQRPKLTGLPGTYRFGMQFHTGRFDNNHINQNGQSLALFGGTRRQEHGNYGFYLMAEQMLFRESKNPQDRRQGLNGFAKAIYSPRQAVNLVDLNFSGGLAYEGPFPGRNRDVIGLAASYSRISDGARNFDRDTQLTNPGTIIRDGEGVIEMIYAAEIAPWWIIIGSLQHIIHPGGSSATPNATAFGISSRFSF